MDIFDSFIYEYNNIEGLIGKLPNAPSEGKIKWLEDTFSDNNIKNKLYYCRMTRNYIQHNVDYRSFINISNEMILFLKDIYKIVFSRLTTVDECMVPLNKCVFKTENDNVFETIKIMDTKRYDYIPIVENGVIKSIFSKNCILSILANDTINKKIKFKDIDSKLLKIDKDEIKFLKTGTLLEEAKLLFDIHNKKKDLKMIIITDTGNSKGKILGLLTEYDL